MIDVCASTRALCERTNQGRSSSCEKPEAPAKVTRAIVLDGDFEEIVGSNPTQFLQECTRKLSSDDRDVECVDVRPGSIIVDIRGSTEALDAAVLEVETVGLDLPNFSKLELVETTSKATTKASGKVEILA